MDEKIKEPAATKTIALICTLVSALCLVAGFGLGRNWEMLLFIISGKNINQADYGQATCRSY